MVKCPVATKKHVCKAFLMMWKWQKHVSNINGKYLSNKIKIFFLYFECFTNVLQWQYVSFTDKVKYIKILQCLELKGICTPHFSHTVFEVSAFSSILRGGLQTVGIF